MRAIIIVLDSLGVGQLPDAEAYGDREADTLGHIHEKTGLQIPYLRAMGLGNIQGAAGGMLAVQSPEG